MCDSRISYFIAAKDLRHPSCTTARIWVTNPESSSPHTGDSVADNRDATPQIGDLTDDLRWFEIPLSDEDEQPSPRGVLQFRKASETDAGLSQAGDVMPYPSGTSLRRRRNSSSSTHSSDQSSSLLSPISLASVHFSSRPEGEAQLKGEADTTSISARIVYQGQRDELESGMAYMTVQSTSVEGGFQMKGFSSMKESPTLTNSSMMSSGSRTAGTQTPKDCDDFASTRTALQHQLADALNALDLTRKQADALRDRLRTYTSSMKQQADDLRASSRSLSHALDKAKEYKIQWKNESKLKDEAKRKVDELDSSVKSLQKTLNQRESEMRTFHQGIDTLNILLGVDSDHSMQPNDKISCTSNAIKQLLQLLEKLQTEAAVSSLVSMVELKESLRNFEEEKQSWISFTKANEQTVSDKISTLQNENEMLQAKLDKVQQSSVEVRNRLSQAENDRANSDAELHRSQRLIITLQATLRTTEAKLLKSVEGLKKEALENSDLKAVFTQKQCALEMEKKMAEENFMKLTKMLENRKINVRDKATSYALDSREFHCDVAIQTSQQDSQQISDNVVEIDKSDDVTMSLQREIDDLKWSLWNMKRDFSEREDDYFRMLGDFRQLRWTCHCQEVTVQTVRAENKALKTSIAKLKLAKEENEYDETETNESDGQLIKRSDSCSESERERLCLQTISENSENCCSPGDVMASLSIVPDETLLRDTPLSILSSVSTDIKQATESRTLTSMSINDESIVHYAAITLRNESRGTMRTESENSQSSGRKRNRRSRKHRFPIWRQENPNNQYSLERLIEDSSGTDTDDVFSHRDVRPLRTRHSASSPSSANSKYSNNAPRNLPQNKHQLGIPMSEQDFSKLVGSMNSSSFLPWQNPTVDTSLYDDGYSSSVVDVLESRPRSRQLRRTLLGYEIDSIPSESDEPTQTEPSDEYQNLGPCLVSYGGLTFDAMKFGMVEMRQFMCDLGIAHSANEMHKFIDFLAEKVHELDNDPVWRGSHNLGKSEDWLSLKCLF